MRNRDDSQLTITPRLGLLVPVCLVALLVGILWWGISAPKPDTRATAESSGLPDETAALPSDMEFPPIERYVEPLRSTFEGQPERAAASALESQLGLVTAYWQANASEALAAAVAGSTPVHRFETEALRYITEYGIDAYRDAAWLAWPRFERELRALLERAHAEQRSISSLLSDPTDPSAQAYQEACGDFHVFALSTGLITEQGALTVPPQLVTALFLYRWNQLVSQIVPVEQSLPPVVVQAVLRWRIEVAQGLSVDRRLQFASDYAAMFPDDQQPGPERTRALLESLASAEREPNRQEK